MNEGKLLKLVEGICLISDNESVNFDVLSKEKVTKRERKMAEALRSIYIAVHSQGKCKHKDWEEDAEKMYKGLRKSKII